MAELGSFFCDTTVLFAASDTAHRHHSESLDLVAAADPSRSFIAAHSLAELYATLSATPAPKIRRVGDVLAAVEHASRVFTPVTLALADYQWVLRHVAVMEVRSAQVCDALILRCAEIARADVVYTWNTRHFKHLAWPEMANRIRAPGL